MWDKIETIGMGVTLVVFLLVLAPFFAIAFLLVLLPSIALFLFLAFVSLIIPFQILLAILLNLGVPDPVAVPVALAATIFSGACWCLALQDQPDSGCTTEEWDDLRIRSSYVT